MRVLGPYFAIELALKASAESNPPPGDPYFSLTPKVSIGAGLKLEVMGRRSDVNVTLGTDEWPAFKLFGNPRQYLEILPGDVELPPGGTRQFTARRSDGTTRPVTWTLDGAAGDAISSTGLLTTKAPGNRRLTVRAKDDTGLQTVITGHHRRGPRPAPAT
jgi:hypothetical protein